MSLAHPLSSYYRHASPAEGAPAAGEPPGERGGWKGRSTIIDVNITSLPDAVLVGLWPRERIFEGLCVGDPGLTRALLAAPSASLTSPCMGRGSEGQAALGLALRAMACLEELDLVYRAMRGGEAAALGPCLPSGLRRLVLSRHSQSGGDEESVDDLRALFPHAQGDEGLAALVPFLARGLQHLDLERLLCGPLKIGRLAAALPCGLRHLNLGCNFIGDDGLRELAPLLPLHLVYLNLSSNDVGIAGARSLAPYLHPSLRHLHLEGNDLGAKGSKGSKTLVFPFRRLVLTIREGSLSAEDVDALETRIPGILMVWF